MNSNIKHPLISIITATFNSSDFILQTYSSICSQNYSNWEWLVTDDCSSDNTFDILSEIMHSDSRVRLFKNNVNSGAAVSRNKSLDNAKGDFVAFLDADDLWHKDKLSKQLNFMINNNICFTFTAYKIIDEKGNSLNKTVDTTNIGIFTYRDMLLKKATMGCSTVLVRIDTLSDFRMPLIRTGQDYAFWLSILKGGCDAHILPEVLTEYRITKGSISRNKLKKAIRQWCIYREIERIDFFHSVYYFFSYSWRAIFRKV